MLKILYYTVSTPDASALACTKLMHKSLVQKLGDIDFKIVVPQGEEAAYPAEVQHLLLSGAKVNPKWPVILDLKYTRTIFELDYDHFVFLDSDILWFANDFDPRLNQYCEDVVPINNLWCSSGWPFVPEPTRKGINAGFFSLDRQTGMAMAEHIRASMSVIDEWSPPLEQSVYNLFLYEAGYRGWHNLTEKFVLFAREVDKVEDGKIYHFMNFAGHMHDKIKKMEAFLENNSSEELVKPFFNK